MERLNLNLRTQYITDSPMFSNGTPSDFIIFKKLCGTGATHGEAKVYKRHSIIIVPNTPVLKGKKEAIDSFGNVKYPDIFVVYEGVTRQDVMTYLNSEVTYKKLLCTPEAYLSKIKPAIEDHNAFDLYADFFMLLDECDRIVKDSDFRSSITAPMDDFFKFKNKAMISATALIPSDKRFEDNGFKRLYVKPKFKFKQKITLINTNNLISALRAELNKVTDEKVFIFLNSVELIQVIIELLEIEDSSKVFCAQNSRTNLLDAAIEGGFDNVSTELGDFQKYNFLTSKFFNAVDIDLEEKPKVIMVTDILRKAFSMLDPYTDSVQIAGRFRNGLKDLVHISNFNGDMDWKEKVRAISYLKSAHDIYKGWEVMRDSTNEEGAIVALNHAMDTSFIKGYIKENGELNPYLVDCYLLDQRITSHYTHINNLNRGYLHSNFFRPTVAVGGKYDVSDSEIISLKMKTNESTLIANVARLLLANDTLPEEGTLNFDFGRGNEIIKKLYPVIANYYNVIGYEAMLALNFNKAAINKQVKIAEKTLKIHNPKMVFKIQSMWRLTDTPSELDIVARLQVVYKDFGVSENAKATHIKRYFEATRTTDRQGIKVYKIKGKISL